MLIGDGTESQSRERPFRNNANLFSGNQKCSRINSPYRDALMIATTNEY